MNPTALAAVDALGSEFLSMLRKSPSRFGEWEAAALELGRRCITLEARDRGRCAVKSTGRGWEYPQRASLDGLAADARYAAGWHADHRLASQQ